MNVALRTQAMTQAEFLEWACAQEGRYEFDGFQPVAMTGGTYNHSRISENIRFALGKRLEGGPCQVLGEAGVATMHDAVRYPEALVTCSKVPGNALVIPGVVVVFEVVSPSSARMDHYVKVREYHAVASIRRYVILESTSMDLTVFTRQDHATEWAASTLTGDGILHLPEIGASVPVAEFYRQVDLPDAGQAAP